MADLDQRFRESAGIRVPDLWPDIANREPRPTPPDGRWRRPVAIATALVVAAAAIGFAGWAFLGGRNPGPRPVAPTCAGTFEVVPHEVASQEIGSEYIQDVLALSPGDAWAVGWSGFVSHGPVSPIGGARILHWDGTSWTEVAAPIIDAFEHGMTGTFPVRGRLGYLQSVDGVGADDVWAVGSASGTLIEHWDGTEWSRVDSPVSGRSTRATLVSVSAVSRNDVWAVGGDQDGPLVLHWDGSRWSKVTDDALDTPDLNGTELATVLAVGPDDVWASGDVFDEADRGHRVLMLHWDGSSWDRVPAVNVVPSGTTSIGALAASGPNDVWGVGFWSRLSHTGAPVFPLIERWNGTAWSQVDAPPMAGDGYRFLSGLAVALPDDVWAVGWGADIISAKGTRHALLEHWDGSKWSDVPNDIPAESLDATSALSSGELWVVGRSEHGDGPNDARAVFAHRSCERSTGD